MPPQTPKTPWTIMVYISADDVLANFAIESLNQLRRAAGGRVVVKAQFDATGRRGKVLRYCFDKPDDGHTPLKDAILSNTDKKIDMTDPNTLTEFVDWASGDSDQFEGRNHCLVLWGHGQMLLAQDPRSARPKYLTLAKLKEALEKSKMAKAKRKLDIIGFDACSMSMVELASELGEYAHFMVASQEEVPDASFPYERFLSKLKGKEDGGEICKEIPKLYNESFQDYLIGNGMKQITLSSLDLEQTKKITGPLKELAQTLLISCADNNLANVIVKARSTARNFVGGLFVDLGDFCDQLADRLKKTKAGPALLTACEKVSGSIKDKDGCVIANETGKEEPESKAGKCCGISIYFPYSIPSNENAQNIRLLSKSQAGIVWEKGGTDILRKARNESIEELEADFKQLKCFQETSWGEFIARGWSRVLAQKFPRNLDLYYSAQQCARNLLSFPGKQPPATLRVLPSLGSRSSRKSVWHRKGTKVG